MRYFKNIWMSRRWYERQFQPWGIKVVITSFFQPTAYLPRVSDSKVFIPGIPIRKNPACSTILFIVFRGSNMKEILWAHVFVKVSRIRAKLRTLLKYKLQVRGKWLSKIDIVALQSERVFLIPYKFFCTIKVEIMNSFKFTSAHRGCLPPEVLSLRYSHL